MNLFGRKIKLTLISTSKVTKTFSSDDGFSIEFNIGFGTKATGSVKIYNVLKSTIEMCSPLNPGTKKVEYAKMELYAGYDDELLKITSASILSNEYNRNGMDMFLELKTGSLVDILQNNHVVKTFQNFTVSQILTSIFLDADIISYDINLGTYDKIIPKICFNGTLQVALNELAKISNSVYYEKFGRIVFEAKESSTKMESSLVLLSPKSGLVGYPEIKKSNLKVKSLLNPKLTTGVEFQLKMFNDINKLNGYYKILDGKHFGGNKAEAFFTEFECKKS